MEGDFLLVLRWIQGDAVTYREYPAAGPDSAGYQAALQRRQGKADCEVLLLRVGLDNGEQGIVVYDVPVDVLRTVAEGGMEYWEDGPLVMRQTEAGIRVASMPEGSPALSGGMVLPAGWVLRTLAELEADLSRERRKRGGIALLLATVLGAVMITFWISYHTHRPLP